MNSKKRQQMLIDKQEIQDKSFHRIFEKAKPTLASLYISCNVLVLHIVVN